MFVTRLKTSTNPKITTVHRAAKNARVSHGLSLDEALEQGLLPMHDVVDLDVELSLGNQTPLAARVVGLPVEQDGKTVTWWYLTNLPRAKYAPELLRDLYRLR